MSKTIILFSVSFLFIFTSCKTVFETTGSGENFNALTRITEPGIIYAAPRGGDNGVNLIFAGLQNNAWNIYLKDQVLASSFIQKTNGENNCYTPDYCLSTQNIAFAYLSSGNLDICYINAKSGKAISKLVSSTDQEFNPSWSSDGKFLTYETGMPQCAYSSIVYGGSIVTASRIISNQIWVKDLTTNEVKCLVREITPNFHPMGKKSLS